MPPPWEKAPFFDSDFHPDFFLEVWSKCTSLWVCGGTTSDHRTCVVAYWPSYEGYLTPSDLPHAGSEKQQTNRNKIFQGSPTPNSTYGAPQRSPLATKSLAQKAMPPANPARAPAGHAAHGSPRAHGPTGTMWRGVYRPIGQLSGRV